MRSKYVLSRQKDFDAAYRFGRSQASRFVILFYRKNGLDYSRISYLASRKVGNSVCRNRARRLMKEAFRLSGMVISPGYDLILIARGTISDADMQSVKRSVTAVFKKARGVLV